MTEPMAVRVFFEPMIQAHDPSLYSGPVLDDAGVTPAEAAPAAPSSATAMTASSSFTACSALRRSMRPRPSSTTMTRADDPGCEMVWYEGGLRDHIPLDSRRRPRGRRPLHGCGPFALGQEGIGLPAVEPSLRAAHVRKFMGFIDRHPPLAALARHPEILGLVQRLIEGNPELFQEMALIKPPKGREKPWHQDHAYFNLALGTPIAGVWIPMEPVSPKNGCMYVLRGGHREGPRTHFKRRDWQICDTEIGGTSRVALPMQPGDVLVFDGLLPHGTPTNRTDSFRWAVQFHYRPATAQGVDDDTRLAAFGSEGKNVTC